MGFLVSHWHCILPVAFIGYFIYKSFSDTKVKDAPAGRSEMSSMKTLENKFASGEITESEYLRKKDLLQQ